MSRTKFRPTLRQTLTQNAALFDHMASMAPADKQQRAQEFADSVRAAIPPERKRRVPKDGINIDAIHGTKRNPPRQLEGPVLTDIGEFLKHHPSVFLALRFNSGAVQRQTFDGDSIPMWFHRWIKRPEKMRIVDFIGWLRDGRSFAIEAKKPTWTRPHDDREREQAIFLESIRKLGGVAGFARSTDEARIIIES